MARYCFDRDTAPILNAAEYWREKCLLENQSVFTADTVWTEENANQLVENYVQRPDLGGRDFNEKLRDQLSPVSQKSRQLTAEMLWFMLLCPSNINPNRKRENINTILRWDGSEIDSGHT